MGSGSSGGGGDIARRGGGARRHREERYVVMNTCLHRQLWPYFRDLQDQALAELQRIETLEQTLPEMRSTLALMGNLKSISIDTTLSMVATIFLPLNFLAGIFGSECRSSSEVFPACCLFPLLRVACVCASCQ